MLVPISIFHFSTFFPHFKWSLIVPLEQSHTDTGRYGTNENTQCGTNETDHDGTKKTGVGGIIETDHDGTNETGRYGTIEAAQGGTNDRYGIDGIRFNVMREGKRNKSRWSIQFVDILICRIQEWKTRT